MDYFKPSLIAAAILFSGSSHAFFVTAATPAGWVATATGATYSTAGQVAAWIQTSEAVAAARVSSAVNVAGKAVNVPALLRLAPTAGRVLAGAAFSNPVAFGALAIGALALDHYMQKQFFVDPVDTIWKKKEMVSEPCVGCVEYSLVASKPVWTTSASSACSAGLAMNFPYENYSNPRVSGNSCIADAWVNDGYGGGYWVNNNVYGYMTSRPVADHMVEKSTPVTEDEMITEMKDVPVTAQLLNNWPLELPPLPVQKPELNPSPLPQTMPVAPAVLPQTAPTPLRVPQASPTEVTPATNPKTYTTPVIDIKPANTETQPWQVDVTTKTITSTSAEPLPETAPVPTTPTPNPDGTTPTETPTEKPIGLCDEYPDILACAKPDLDTPKEDPLGDKKVNVSITPDGGWGGNGSCPAPRHLDGANVDFEFTGVCDFMTGIRPVIIAFAWLAAAMILIGVRSSGSD